MWVMMLYDQYSIVSSRSLVKNCANGGPKVFHRVVVRFRFGISLSNVLANGCCRCRKKPSAKWGYWCYCCFSRMWLIRRANQVPLPPKKIRSRGGLGQKVVNHLRQCWERVQENHIRKVYLCRDIGSTKEEHFVHNCVVWVAIVNDPFASS